MIVRNVICCKWCGDIIESTYTHDYKECSCQAVAVDGGHEYLRRCFKEEGDYLELSVSLYKNERWSELKIGYKEVWKKLIDLKMNKTRFRSEVGISQNSLSRMGRKQPIRLEDIFKICRFLDGNFADLIKIEREGPTIVLVEGEKVIPPEEDEEPLDEKMELPYWD